MPDKKSTKHPLTQTNLELHNQQVERASSLPHLHTIPRGKANHQQGVFEIRPTSWAEKVIRNEQIHQFHSSLSPRSRNHDPHGLDDIIRDINHLTLDKTPTPDQTIGSLRLFEPREGDGICLERPLERFFTPDGCECPSHFTRPALEHSGIRFGGLDGRDERTSIARRNSNMARRKNQGKRSGSKVFT